MLQFNKKQLGYLKNLTLLYAEDDECAQQTLSMILEDYVGNIIVAKNGAEALQIFHTQKIDLLIADILMPKINGIELARTIKENTSGTNSIPIIFATAFTETQYLLESIKLRCDGYIVKPINLDLLFEAIHNAMLPRIQLQEIVSKDMLLDFLNIFVGGKKIEVIKYILEHCDSQNIFHGSHEDIADSCNITRPTVAKTFQQLIELGLLIKIRNKTYHINTNIRK
ncbi:DNA-binding response regulator [Helicobacter aurati]|uniref:DNA-binding response regulator n=2 Tax=Helicobacter aurati TaxID=137778 RepID=A0A3D8J683_9HELI|nr:response regulator transcription factor [Helicobacter aurati]RDU72968.1 DNA-binding response regulator [Helicobacter aurati]